MEYGMAEAADYRNKAQHCLQLAEQAADDFHRKNFLQLAAMWSEMASKAESRRVADPALDDREVIDEALETIRNVGGSR